MLVFAALAALSFYFSCLVIHIRTHTDDAILGFEIDGGRITREEFDALPKEDVSIPSPFGYRLRAWFIPACSGETGKTVVFPHGVTSSLLGMLKYTGMFRKRGYNVLVYDHRRHGSSGGDTTTYGFYEKWDLRACVDWALHRCASSGGARGAGEPVIGIFGESMGAATALQHVSIDDRVSFYVADCPFSDLADQLSYQLKVRYKLPRFPLIPLTSLWCRLRAGFYFHQVSPIRDVARANVPILYVHGQNDVFVPTRMSVELHRATGGPKSLFLAPNSGHAESYYKNKVQYEQAVDAFLAEAMAVSERPRSAVAAASLSEDRQAVAMAAAD